MLSTHFNATWINQLLNTANKEISGTYNGVSYHARIVIPNYKRNVEQHYADIISGNIDTYCLNAEVSPVYEHYGVEISFDKALQMDAHDDEQVLEPGLKQILHKVGPIIFKNAYFSSQHREVHQRNSFPHLNFHIDRHINMPTRFSVYTRDPFDEEQKHPRKSSTLFIASIVGYLQAVKENLINPAETKGINQSFEIFRDMKLDDFIGKIMIEHRWDEPEGVGELSMLDNATELHSSYERIYATKGYRIGVRYVA